MCYRDIPLLANTNFLTPPARRSFSPSPAFRSQIADFYHDFPFAEYPLTFGTLFFPPFFSVRSLGEVTYALSRVTLFALCNGSALLTSCSTLLQFLKYFPPLSSPPPDLPPDGISQGCRSTGDAHVGFSSPSVGAVYWRKSPRTTFLTPFFPPPPSCDRPQGRIYFRFASHSLWFLKPRSMIKPLFPPYFHLLSLPDRQPLSSCSLTGIRNVWF